MRTLLQQFMWMFFLLTVFNGRAQTVFYSPYLRTGSSTKIEVAGNSGKNYWVLNEKVFHSRKAENGQVAEQHFEIYDARMNRINTTDDFVVPADAEKEYLVAGEHYFDRMFIVQAANGTKVNVLRFTPDGNLLNDNTLIAEFPFSETAGSFLLVRSEDRSKILLLCFESIPSSPPRLHALLFDSDWKQISNLVYDNPSISQPMIQDDFLCYPLECYNSDAVQLANNGEWLMTSRSRTNNNYLLFHFCSGDPSIMIKEIRLPEYSVLEDLALYVDNETGGAFAGLLSRFKYKALKAVQVVHYDLQSGRFDFDSSYRFNTLPGVRVLHENLVREQFLAVPGYGFMLMKEYGKSYDDLRHPLEETPWDMQALFAGTGIAGNFSPGFFNRDNFTRSGSLNGIRDRYDRGDLSVFYLPGRQSDSSWSGILNKEQLTDFNLPWLSYLVLPVKEKLYFLYNTTDNEDQFGSSTILNVNGNPEAGGVLFWKFRIKLNFQLSRQINAHEVAIPYQDEGRSGFAIIKM